MSTVIWRHDASLPPGDVSPRCVVLAAYCPRRRRALRLTVQGVPGTRPPLNSAPSRWRSRPPGASPGQNMWRGQTLRARAYNRGLGAEPTGPAPYPCKNSSDLYQFQERPLAKVGWTCPPRGNATETHHLIQCFSSLPAKPTHVRFNSTAQRTSSCALSCLTHTDHATWRHW